MAVVLALASTTSARADDPSVSELQVRLVESRQHLISLYAQSAAASERLNGATYELERAEASLVRQRAQLARASARLAVQREVVAELSVEQLMSGSSITRLTTMLDGGGPDALLERASAYSTVDEAMNARMDLLAAQQVVHDAAESDAEDAVDAQRRATADLRSARSGIRQAISSAEAAATSTRAERRSLLRQLADAQRAPVAVVTRRQDAIDRRLDESGPAVPTPPAPDEPDPTPRPTHSQPPPPADPPPASSSRVETAIAFARKQLGEPYRWGAAGPSSWDCSGLTMRAWQAAGVSLPHYAGSQYTQTKRVSVGKIKRGDLLYWSNGGPGSIYHVALYLGGGQMIQAPRPGRGVEIVSLSYWIQPDLASRPG